MNQKSPLPIINMMRDAASEIRSLRRHNEILSAKVEVFDSLMCLLHTKPAEHLQGASPDVAWALDQKAAELKQAQPNVEP